MTEQLVGNHLRTLRFNHGRMSQATLAQIVGVTRQTIVAIETGQYAPSLELAMRLSTVFGCGVDDAFFWVDPKAAQVKYKTEGGGT